MIRYKLLPAYLLWWVFWSIFQAVVLHNLGWIWQISVTDAAITMSLMALGGIATENLYRFYKPGNENRIYRFLYGIGLTGCSVFATKLLLAKIFPTENEYLEFFETSIPIRFAFSLLMTSFITLVSWLWYYIKEKEAEILRKTDAENLLKEAELANLQLKLQPHFLFNSLNSINALVGSRPDDARKMIQKLSEFLRGTLKKDDRIFISLASELANLDLYLDIEKMRFGHRLQTLIFIEKDVENFLNPSLLLQPVVENAIKFGLYDTLGEISIQIKGNVDAGNLVLEISNPFDPETLSAGKGTGFGLSAIHRRLFLLFGRTDLLQTHQLHNVFITQLIIPQQK